MKNVLLIDDESIFHFLGTRMLGMLGVPEEGVRTALNGRQALTLLNEYYRKAKTFPDIILLDLNMPIMDGFGFLEAFGKLELPHKEHVKIIVLTSSRYEADISKALKLGASYYLTKPLKEESLREALAA
jgi:CheY-like chemotaxis protein